MNNYEYKSSCVTHMFVIYVQISCMFAKSYRKMACIGFYSSFKLFLNYISYTIKLEFVPII